MVYSISICLVGLITLGLASCIGFTTVKFVMGHLRLYHALSEWESGYREGLGPCERLVVLQNNTMLRTGSAAKVTKNINRNGVPPNQQYEYPWILPRISPRYTRATQRSSSESSHIRPNVITSCSGLVVAKMTSVTGVLRHASGDILKATCKLQMILASPGNIFSRFGAPVFSSASQFV